MSWRHYERNSNLLLTYLLTYSMVQSPSWAANWFAASQEIPRSSRNPKVHYRTHKRPPRVSIIGQPNHLLTYIPKLIHNSKNNNNKIRQLCTNKKNRKIIYPWRFQSVLQSVRCFGVWLHFCCSWSVWRMFLRKLVTPTVFMWCFRIRGGGRTLRTPFNFSPIYQILIRNLVLVFHLYVHKYVD